MRAASKVAPSVVSLSDIVMGQSATVTDGSSDNFCPVPKKQPSHFLGSGEGHSLRTSLKAGSAGLEALDVISGWFDEGGVKLLHML